ncbi:chavicol O-methyltransferase-like [Andrographis paniculata]|uniref:chavicol O-methyltransferase-like n=1 Tax=Andrographis paniculata TaxID=175694 RepID=UPI0021E705BF|nr:chavicol O-methyltransferase-like [Andrographis paniculata]
MAKVNGNAKLGTTEEMLQAQARMWKDTFSFVYTMAINCAVELGIPDIVHRYGRPMPHSKLVEELPLAKSKVQDIHRIMRVLVYSKVFVIDEKSGNDEPYYSLSPAGALLLKDAPMAVAPYFPVMLNHETLKAWSHISKWFVAGDEDSPFETAHGKTLWQCFSASDPKIGNSFNESMSCDTRFVMSILLNEYKHIFEGIDLLVDVGGNVGTALKTILDVFPGMKGIVFDQERVVGSLKGTHNLTYVAGDMLKQIPRGDAILFKWILHDWNDDYCQTIFKNCREALPEGGKIIIIDMVLSDDYKADNDNTDVVREAQILFDMMVMTYLGGKERTKKEWEKLFADAGLTNYKFNHVLGARSVIEVYV